MQPEYEFLTEKKAMWAEMLEEVLRDWNIPYAALPVYGAGLALSAGDPGVPPHLRPHRPKASGRGAAGDHLPARGCRRG